MIVLQAQETPVQQVTPYSGRNLGEIFSKKKIIGRAGQVRTLRKEGNRFNDEYVGIESAGSVLNKDTEKETGIEQWKKKKMPQRGNTTSNNRKQRAMLLRGMRSNQTYRYE